MQDRELARRLAAAARPLEGAPTDWDALVDAVGDAQIVLIGEASHGTHEFYDLRARITQRLIDEKGFDGVAAEADWPDSYRVARYVRGASDDRSAEESLRGFARFPTWMWRNTVVVEFVEWLQIRNAALKPGEHAAGFYGIDLYSMFTSMHEVIRHLDEVDPEAGARARQRYACFDHFDQDSQAYGYAAAFHVSKSCEDEAVRQLVEMQERALSARAGALPDEEEFYARENARLVKSAEEYYRTMYFGEVSSWNLRDRHMVETLESLVDHLRAGGRAGKLVIWAHNSHVGDARATQMGAIGEWNLGQLARERWGHDVAIIGFTTHAGTVTAASGWDEPGERKRVLESLPQSWERLMHDTGVKQFLLDLRAPDSAEIPRGARLERAIGVIYLPRTERASHYFHAHLASQFDWLIHLDETTALQPLEPGVVWESGEADTFPFAV